MSEEENDTGKERGEREGKKKGEEKAEGVWATRAELGLGRREDEKARKKIEAHG